MKKTIAWVTSFCLAFSLLGIPVVGFADEGDGADGTRQNAEETDQTTKADEGQGEGQDADAQGAAEGSGQGATMADLFDSRDLTGALVAAAEEQQPQADAANGALRVVLQSYAPAKAVSGTQFRLEDAAGNVTNHSLTAKEASADEAAGSCREYFLSVSDLTPGTYTLSCGGEGYFAAYSQAVEVEPAHRAEISLIDSLATTSGERGTMLYGDFDRSGAIDAADAGLLVAALGTESPEHAVYGSDAVSLADVQFFASFFMPGEGQGSSSQARIFQKVDPSQMSLTEEEGTEVEGDLSSLFEDDGTSVTLTPTAVDGEEPVISANTPVRVGIDTKGAEMEGLTLRAPLDSEGMPRTGSIRVEPVEGDPTYIPFSDPTYVPPAADAGAAEASAAAEEPREEGGFSLMSLFGATPAQAEERKAGATVDPANGLIVVDFGNRVAIKKIIINVTGTSSNKLAEIAQVEFLNHMEERIAPPELNVPKGLTGTPGKKSFRVTWGAESNVTGYEVKVEQGGKSVTLATAVPSLEVSRFNGSDLRNETTYTVSVRSANGEWRSPWSGSIQVTPKATSVPARPTGVTAVGGYGEVTVSWRSAEDALSYVLYYREKGSSANYQQVPTTQTSHTISPLSLNASYEGYVVAKNDIGDSPRSGTWEARTVSASSVKVPWYKLINRTTQTGQQSDSHIEDVVCGEYKDGKLVRDYHDYEKAPNFQPRQVVDGNYDTTFWSKRESTYYDGPTVTFDKEYNIGSFAMTTYLGSGYCDAATLNVRAYDAEGKLVGDYDGGNWLKNVIWSSVPGAPNTMMVTLDKPVMAKSIRVGFMRAYAAQATISELAFYEYDGIQDSLDALWEDAAHTQLKGDVSQAKLDEIKASIEWTDPAGDNERHPQYELLLKEWQYAKDVFDNKDSLGEAVSIDPTIDRSTNAHVGGLSSMQPLGVAVHAGDEIDVFVGRDGLAPGSNTALRLYVGQYHADSGHVLTQLVPTLKAGRNTVTVDLGSTPPAAVGESGGSLYVEYASSDRTQQYSVRVLGGTDIPMLNLRGVTDQAERLERCQRYIDELTEFTGKLEGLHSGATDRKNGHVDTEGNVVAFQPGSCVINYTEISLDSLLYSIPATQAMAGVRANGSGKAKLNRSMEAAEEMMRLFYQHKGLVDQSDKTVFTDADKAKYGDKNGLPKGRQNIRYTDMSGSVFMYAAGNHIGIQYGSCTSMTQTPGVTASAEGIYEDGYYFGWGLHHEIGHEINQQQYTYAEVTNNYYSQLGQAKDTNESTRWSDYQVVYDRVTSGLKGMASGKTGIAMYWQLHLAYDDGFNFKSYGTYAEQMENLVFARMDAYARNQAIAPQAAEGGTPLVLAGADKDNAIMRLACAATQKNVLAFFEAWGLTPDASTIAYAAQWPKEERAIQYISDDTRKNGRLKGSIGHDGNYASNVEVAGEVTYAGNSNQVTVNLSNSAKDLVGRVLGPDQSKFLGYEVSRNGKPVGFVEADEQGKATFTDTIATINNRVFTYTVRGVDMNLNYTEAAQCSPEEVKVSHDGSIDKTGWKVSANVYAEDEKRGEGADEDSDLMDTDLPCEQPDSEALQKAIDGNLGTSFTGSKLEGDSSSVQITLTFDKQYAVNALKVHSPNAGRLDTYGVEVSVDGVEWTRVAKGEFVKGEGVSTYWFGEKETGEDGKESFRLDTYDAGYLRMTAPSGVDSVIIDELDVLGPTGDNVSFIYNDGSLEEATGKLVGGTLAEDYVLDPEDPETVIPANSFIIIGSFKGNAAYNAIKLYDQDGKLVNGAFVFFAGVPETGSIGETADGRWVYFVTPEQMASGWQQPTKVRAELYRVDDAMTLENERLVADTMTAAVPTELSNIEIKSDVNAGGDATKNA